MNLSGGWFGAGEVLGSKGRKGNATTLLATERAGRQPEPVLSYKVSTGKISSAPFYR